MYCNDYILSRMLPQCPRNYVQSLFCKQYYSSVVKNNSFLDDIICSFAVVFT